MLGTGPTCAYLAGGPGDRAFAAERPDPNIYTSGRRRGGGYTYAPKCPTKLIFLEDVPKHKDVHPNIKHPRSGLAKPVHKRMHTPPLFWPKQGGVCIVRLVYAFCCFFRNIM